MLQELTPIRREGRWSTWCRFVIPRLNLNLGWGLTEANIAILESSGVAVRTGMPPTGQPICDQAASQKGAPALRARRPASAFLPARGSFQRSVLGISPSRHKEDHIRQRAVERFYIKKGPVEGQILLGT